MSKKTGIWLKKYLQDNGYKKIILRCSPFIRTLQTASQIAKSFDIQDIQIDYQLHEALYRKLFSEGNPESSLIIRNNDPKKVSEEYLDGVNYIDTNDEDLKYFKETFPEDRDTVG